MRTMGSAAANRALGVQGLTGAAPSTLAARLDRLFATGGRCNGTANGTKVELWDCDGSAARKFTLH